MIANAIESNHKLIGFHFAGHYGFINSLLQFIIFRYINQQGFLIVENEKMNQMMTLETFHRINESIIKKLLLQKKVQETFAGFVRGFNLICLQLERWQEITFSFPTVKQELELANLDYIENKDFEITDSDQIYLHLDFEQYKAIPMEKAYKNFYQCKKVCPPTEIKYFFSKEVDSKIQIFVVIEQQPEYAKNWEIINISSQNHEVPLIEIDRYHKLKISTEKQIVDEYYYANIDCIPRFQEPDVQKIFKISLFKLECISPRKLMIKKQPNQKPYPKYMHEDFLKETDNLLKRCLDFDYHHSKLPKLFSKIFYPILEKHYRTLKNAYLVLRSLCTDTHGDVTAGILVQFLSHCKVIDGMQLNLTLVDLKVKAAKQQRQQRKGMNRGEFLEVLVRVAEERFHNGSIQNDFEQLMQEYIVPVMKGIQQDHVKWRMEQFWSVDMQKVAKTYQFQIKNLFRKYANSLVSSLHLEKFLWIVEFKQLFLDNDFLNKNFSEQDITLIFNQSVLTQIDEINSERHLQMNFFEFQEAMGRIAQKINLLPVGFEVNFYYKQLSKQILQSVPLPLKFESLIIKLSNNILLEKGEQQNSKQNQNKFSIFYQKSDNSFQFEDLDSYFVEQLQYDEDDKIIEANQNKEGILISSNLSNMLPPLNKGNALREKLNRSLSLSNCLSLFSKKEKSQQKSSLFQLQKMKPFQYFNGNQDCGYLKENAAISNKQLAKIQENKRQSLKITKK